MRLENGHHSGDLRIENGQTVTLNEITSIGGDLTIHSDAQLPSLTRIGGDLTIRSDAQLPILTHIGGDLEIYAKVQLPALLSVGGCLEVHAIAQLPMLKNVGGRFEITAAAHLPVLTRICGFDVANDGVALLAVARQIVANPTLFDMVHFHQQCGTVHCLAGHGVHFAGPAGYALEESVGPPTAGAILLGIEAAHYFFRIQDDSTFEFLKSVVAKADAALGRN